MAIDRRIVSILYYNGITDVNEIDKFIGESNGYYQVEINGEIKNLEIPGFHYNEKLSTEEIKDDFGVDKIIIDYYSSDFDLEIQNYKQFKVDNRELKIQIPEDVNLIIVSKEHFKESYGEKLPKEKDLLFFEHFYRVVNVKDVDLNYELIIEKYDPIFNEASITNIIDNYDNHSIEDNLNLAINAAKENTNFKVSTFSIEKQIEPIETPDRKSVV